VDGDGERFLRREGSIDSSLARSTSELRDAQRAGSACPLLAREADISVGSFCDRKVVALALGYDDLGAAVGEAAKDVA